VNIGSEPPGATPLNGDELEGLIPDYVATRSDLNRAEADNITNALPEAQRRARRVGPVGIFTNGFLMDLHHRIFCNVWTWAGTQRRRETNIGVDPINIATSAKQAMDDAIYWHEQETFAANEIAVRTHHRLVAIHPFPNGNGRCTRLVVDLYLVAIGAPPLTWGRALLEESGETRSTYIRGLQLADRGDYSSLLEFAQSKSGTAG
jgi:Fic-DOC domain mobile mystery protein B